MKNIRVEDWRQVGGRSTVSAEVWSTKTPCVAKEARKATKAPRANNLPITDYMLSERAYLLTFGLNK
jgi:hypothetical protein